MNQIRYDDGVSPIWDACQNKSPTIFLAGPTVRANQNLTSWRVEALEQLKDFDANVIAPEFYDSSTWEYGPQRSWIMAWELVGLLNADVIMFWVPRQMPELPGLTTNVEFGYWLAKRPNDIVYGHPPDAQRMRYLDHLWKRDAGAEIHISLQDTVLATMKKAYTCAHQPEYQWKPFVESCHGTFIDFMARRKLSDKDAYNAGLSQQCLFNLLTLDYTRNDIFSFERMLKRFEIPSPA